MTDEQLLALIAQETAKQEALPVESAPLPAALPPPSSRELLRELWRTNYPVETVSRRRLTGEKGRTGAARLPADAARGKPAAKWAGRRRNATGRDGNSGSRARAFARGWFGPLLRTGVGGLLGGWGVGILTACGLLASGLGNLPICRGGKVIYEARN